MKTQQPSGDRRCGPQWHKWDRQCASLSSAALFKVEGDKNGTSCQQNLSKFFQEGGAEPTKHGEKKKLNGCQSETLNQFRLINYSLRTHQFHSHKFVNRKANEDWSSFFMNFMTKPPHTNVGVMQQVSVFPCLGTSRCCRHLCMILLCTFSGSQSLLAARAVLPPLWKGNSLIREKYRTSIWCPFERQTKKTGCHQFTTREGGEQCSGTVLRWPEPPQSRRAAPF